jgi:molecular chaperone HtpG
MNTDTQDSAQTHPFQAEVAELLRLMVHSVYSETDIFLRELISNASDALDKLRYEAISRPGLLGGELGLAIMVKPDAQAETLTIADTGAGMDREELIQNLGTIAHSGTRAFVSRLKEARDGAGLIGQFGVGFYSSFMVADRIEVVSRRAGSSEVWVWRCSGGAGFEVAPASEEQARRVPRGTEIILHLKEDAKRYLEPSTLERVTRIYSDHVQFPIMLSEGEAEPRQINTASAVWRRPKSELTPEDYTHAYRSVTGGFDEPAMRLHYNAEGRQSYTALLFAPSMRPFDLFDPARKGRVKLYVRRVYITDDADLLPPWLRFIRGVIDSEDLPLNISREMLQNNPQVALIRKAVTSKILSELERLADKEPEAYAKIWDAFGGVLKEGIYEDPERRDQLLALARFATTAGDQPRSLKDYTASLRPNQTAIYYLTGDSVERLKANPKLEAARARGVEALLLTDPVDAFWTMLPMDVDGKPFKSLSQGDVDFSLIPLEDSGAAPHAESGEDKQTQGNGAEIDETATLAAIKEVLGDRVSDVRASRRLTDSASCLVAGGAGPDRHLELLIARQEGRGLSRPVLEINMRHPLTRAVSDAQKAGQPEDVGDLAALLFEQAQILDGEAPTDPAAFVKRMNRMVARGFATPAN